MKIAYAGIDLMSSALQTLVSDSHEILKLFTCPCDNVTEFNTAVIGIAEKNGIPFTVNRVTERDLAELKQQGCELFLCAGYYYKIPVTEAFPQINLHPAPLPDCRGGWPMPQILLGAYPCGGITAHKIAAGFDTGDILLQSEFALFKTSTLTDYMNFVNERLPSLVRTLTEQLASLLTNAKPQGEGRYLPMPSEKDYTVTYDMTVCEADRIMRAFYGYEIYYLAADGTKYELINCRAAAEKNGLPLKDGFLTAERQRVL